MSANPEKYAAPLLIIGCVVFGLGSLIVKFVPIGSFAAAWWRLLVAGMVFWLLMRRFGQRLPQSRAAVCYALLSGAALGFDLALWHESIHAVGPGISTLLNSLQIFFLSAIGFLFFGEKLSRLQTANLFLAAAGVAMIAAPEFGRNSGAAWGFAAGIVSGAMLALSMAAVRKTHQAEPVALFPLMLLVSAGGILALTLPALVFDAHRFYPATLRDIFLILVYGIVMQCFAWGLIAYAIPLLSLSLTGLLLLSEPVAALAIDFLLLGKPITAVQWCGAALTLFSIYLGSLKSKAH
ncbi:Predicted permease, DMT superfamily [Kingella potus]|uniref:Predicted permease, DMT superfamily n=1 Tax=Kingella potus TaxID=265175 RepID=A0A377QYE9_9NEIS|nr:DMT family transporter [Kingella potus]STR00022.1 Predicted permease, DMT superfamily [Kingella potus]